MQTVDFISYLQGVTLIESLIICPSRVAVFDNNVFSIISLNPADPFLTGTREEGNSETV